MLEDLEGAVASFLNSNDEESITNAVKMSTFDFIKQNKEKFGTSCIARYRSRDLGEEFFADRVVTGSATKGCENWKNVPNKLFRKSGMTLLRKKQVFRTITTLEKL